MQYTMADHDDDPDSWHGWFGRWLSSAPSRWLGKRSGIGLDLVGGSDGLKYLMHMARGNRRLRRDSMGKLVSGVRPVVLIHGFMGTRGSMYPLEKRLEEDGFCVFSFNLGAINLRDIRTSAFRIHRKIEAILAQTKVEEIDIIGHSMGGRSTTYVAAKHPERVAGLVLVDYTPQNAPEGAKRTTHIVANTPDAFASLEEAMKYFDDTDRVRFEQYLKKTDRGFTLKRDPHFLRCCGTLVPEDVHDQVFEIA